MIDKVRSERARQILEDDYFKDAIAKVEASAIERMISAETDDERRRNGDFIKAVRAVKAQLNSWMREGKDRHSPGIA